MLCSYFIITWNKIIYLLRNQDMIIYIQLIIVYSKDPAKRPTAAELLKHPFFKKAKGIQHQKTLSKKLYLNK